MTTPEEIARECTHLWKDGWCSECGIGYATWQRQEITRLEAALAASEQRAENWRNDFQEACRQRDASEQRVRELEDTVERRGKLLYECGLNIAARERALERAKEVINLKIAHKGDCVFVREDFTGSACTCGKLDAALASPGSPQ